MQTKLASATKILRAISAPIALAAIIIGVTLFHPAPSAKADADGSGFEISFTSPAPGNQWYKYAPSITGTITDPASAPGSSFKSYYYVSKSTDRPEEGQWIASSPLYTGNSYSQYPGGTSSGQNYFHYKLINSNSDELYGYVAYRLDSNDPTISTSIDGYIGIYTDFVSPTIYATDDLSGIKELCYSWHTDIDDCSDEAAIPTTTGTTITTTQKYGQDINLYIAAEDYVGNISTHSQTFRILRRPPVVSSFSPTSGPTAGGTTLSISGDYFGENYLDSDEFVISSLLTLSEELYFGYNLVQLTNKNRILVSDQTGTATAVDTSSVDGNIIKLDSAYSGLLVYAYTDTGNIYIIYANNPASPEIYHIPFAFPTPISEVSFTSEDFSDFDIYVLTNDVVYTTTAIFDDDEDGNTQFIIDAVVTVPTECQVATLSEKVYTCTDSTKSIGIIGVDGLLQMPGSVTISSISATKTFLSDKEHILAHIIGSDNKIYVVYIDENTPTGTLYLIDTDYSQIEGSIIQTIIVDEIDFAMVLDDLGNVYTIDGDAVLNISDSPSLDGIRSSIASMHWVGLDGIFVGTTTGDYYSAFSIALNSEPYYALSELQRPIIKLGDSFCTVIDFTDTNITCSTPAHAAGPVAVTFKYNSTTATLAGDFTYTDDPTTPNPPDPSPTLRPTLTDSSTGIIVQHLGAGFTSDLYLSVTPVDPTTRNLGAYASFTNLGIYDITICSTTTSTCEPIHTWGDGLRIKLPLSDTSYDTYHVLFLPNSELANLIDSSIEGDYIMFDSTHLSEYAIVARGNPSTPPTVPGTGAEFLGIPLTPATTGGFVISLIAGAGVALWFTRRKWGKK